MDNQTIELCQITNDDANARAVAVQKVAISHMVLSSTRNLNRFMEVPDTSDVYRVTNSQTADTHIRYNLASRVHSHNLRAIQGQPFNLDYPQNCDNAIREVKLCLDGPLGSVAAARRTLARRTLASVERNLGIVVTFIPSNAALDSPWIPTVESMSHLVLSQNEALLMAMRRLWEAEERCRGAVQRVLAES